MKKEELGSIVNRAYALGLDYALRRKPIDEVNRELEKLATPPPIPHTTLPPMWDGTIRFEKDCVINGMSILAGVYKCKRQ